MLCAPPNHGPTTETQRTQRLHRESAKSTNMKNLTGAIFILLSGLAGVMSTNVALSQVTRPVTVANPVINRGLPIVSPDGLHIAFVADREGGVSDLFVISSDGTGEAQLTQTPEHESPAGWT